MATRGRSYAESLISPLDRSGYAKQREVSSQTYSTNWENLQNKYKELTDKIKRQQDQANEDFANGLIQASSNSFDRLNAYNQNMANKGLNISGLNDLLSQTDIKLKGDEIGDLLQSASDVLSANAEQLKGANESMTTQSNELSKDLASALGDIGDSETSAQNAFNNAYK